ncbi:hypothetical protein F153LOC_11365 [Lelliottia sp. F153]|nr:hypothetical protein DAI21_01785 [Lelliottia sp. WB101]PKA29430.1 hypothetical protein CWR41_05675 [Cedecea lapagei]PLY45973.1 hypothetical protein F159LOC_08600 [Lelliottia sp. F159]PLY50346.1 hypothetical protein F154LOC_11200 [Lelliottia sp. F154]PLY54799.1 hypothetical protein F153LOC_11365 [Lelliottia sp. F153]RXJ12570.1 hypothetical protein ETG88_15370 [Lelliottia nimipressuralis]UQC69777.1 hypothetical protein C0560_02870 [Lelliottia sp. AC1]
MICIKHVCDFFDSEQSKKTRVQTAGTTAIVNPGRKNLIKYSTKTVKYCRANAALPGILYYACSHHTASNGRSVIAAGWLATSA